MTSLNSKFNCLFSLHLYEFAYAVRVLALPSSLETDARKP